MAYNQLLTYAGQALEQWEKPIQHIIVGTQPLLSRIQKENVFKSRNVSYYDNKIIIPSQLGFGPNARTIAAEGYLPTSTTPVFANMTASFITVKARTHIDWEAIAMGNSQAFNVPIAENVVQNMIDSMRHSLENQLWGSPSGTKGVLGRISAGATNSTTQTLNFNAAGAGTSFNGYSGSRRFRRGQPIVIASAADLAGSSWHITNTPRIIDYVPTSTTIVLTAAQTSTTGDLVVNGEYLTAHSARSYEYANGSATGASTWLTGLWDHIDKDAPTTYQGLTRASYPELNAQIVTTGTAGTNAALTEPLIEEMLDAPSTYSFEVQSFPNLILCTEKMRRTIKGLADTYRRIWFDEAPDIGAARDVKIVGRELVASPYAHPGCIYGVNTDSFLFTYISEGGAGDEKFMAFDKDANGGVFKKVGSEADQDIFEALLRCPCQLICLKPAVNAKMEDITEAA